jgi:hypothetical protein
MVEEANLPPGNVASGPCADEPSEDDEARLALQRVQYMTHDIDIENICIRGIISRSIRNVKGKIIISWL